MAKQKDVSNTKEKSKKDKTINGLDKEEKSTPTKRTVILAAGTLSKYKDLLNLAEQAELFGLLIKNEGRPNLKFAQALFDLDKWTSALNVLEDMKEDAEHESPKELKTIEDMIHKCETTRLWQQFKVPFKERVTKTWENFQIYLPELLKKLEEKAPNENGIIKEDIGYIFSGALVGEPICWVEKDGKETKIRVLLESLASGFEWQYIKEQMPEALKKDWSIEIINSPQTDKYLGLYVKGEDGGLARPDFDIDSISLELGENLTAFAYCEDWEPFLRYQDFFGGEYDVVQAILRHFLGDVGCIKYVPRFFVLNIKPPEKIGPTLLPTQLSSFFVDKGFDIHSSVDAILDYLVSYKREPEGSPEEWIPGVPCGDITSGKSMCQKFLGPYFKQEINDNDQLEADGVAAGFFYYTIDSFKGENAQKEREEFQQAFKKELIEKAGTDSVKIVGEATGKKYDYVEILAWDSKKVIDIAEAFFKSSSNCLAYFQTFRRPPHYLILTD